MDNPETLTTLGTQETGRTMIDITLRRKPPYNPDDPIQVIRKRKQSLLNQPHPSCLYQTT
jgi:hypothetical protein